MFGVSDADSAVRCIFRTIKLSILLCGSILSTENFVFVNVVDHVTSSQKFILCLLSVYGSQDSIIGIETRVDDPLLDSC